MGKLIERSLISSDILNVDLLCSVEDDSELLNHLKKKVNINEGKRKILYDSYLVMSYLTKCYDESLTLDGVRVLTVDGEIFTVLTSDILENRIVLSDNALRFMLATLDYVNKQEVPSIKVLDYATLDYGDYKKDENLSKAKGMK